MKERCAKCNGAKKVYIVDRNSNEWEKAWDRYDNSGRYDMNTCNNLADNDCGSWQNCPVCTSTK